MHGEGRWWSRGFKEQNGKEWKVGVGGCQPPLLTLKNGRPGAFYNPCASHKERGGWWEVTPRHQGALLCHKPCYNCLNSWIRVSAAEGFWTSRFLFHPIMNIQSSFVCRRSFVVFFSSCRLLLCGFCVIPGTIRSEFDLLHLVLLWRWSVTLQLALSSWTEPQFKV